MNDPAIKEVLNLGQVQADQAGRLAGDIAQLASRRCDGDWLWAASTCVQAAIAILSTHMPLGKIPRAVSQIGAHWHATAVFSGRPKPWKRGTLQ